MSALPAGAGEYDPGGGWDEAFVAPGEVREHYRDVMEALAEIGLEEAFASVDAHLRERDVRFGGEDGQEFVVDPVPRVLTSGEWAHLAEGLRQRVLALDAFVRDVHGERRVVDEGIVPEHVLGGTTYLEDDLRGMEPVGGALVAVAGLDVVRHSDGRFMVLEDNVRTPSGSAYALAASEAVETVLPVHTPHEQAAAWISDALLHALEATNPDGQGELVLLTDGPANSAWYEHRRLAELTGLRLVQPDDLRRRGARLELREGDAPVRAV
jgi:uncharacterized circularly permuted ATP-grasp superfamily protein